MYHYNNNGIIWISELMESDKKMFNHLVHKGPQYDIFLLAQRIKNEVLYVKLTPHGRIQTLWKKQQDFHPKGASTYFSST